jgi:membrane protein implicated in regulation of membrane protease activity
VAASTRRSAHVARLGLVTAVLAGVVAVLIGRIPPAMAGLIEDPIWSAALDAGCSSLMARLRTWLLVTVAVGVVVAVLVIIGTRWHRRPRIDSDHGSDRGSDRRLGETTSVSASGTD